MLVPSTLNLLTQKSYESEFIHSFKISKSFYNIKLFFLNHPAKNSIVVEYKFNTASLAISNSQIIK